MNKGDLLKLRQDCETWLRNGEGARVSQALSSLNIERIPRAGRLPLAALARRANFPNLGLRLLAPIVRAEKINNDASPAEIAEYAILLCIIGSVSESLELLKPLTIPEAYFYKAHCHFSRWEYSEARPLLEKYLSNTTLDDYRRIVGRLNLASIAVFEADSGRARSELAAIETEASTRGFSRILANALELGSQVDIIDLDYTSAEKKLKRASDLLRSDSASDTLYVQKWQNVLEMYRTGMKYRLESFRDRARSSGHWEVVRDSELKIAQFEKNALLERKVYFGTPYAPYRRRFFAAEFSEPFALGAGKRELTLSSGEVDGRELFDGARKIHQLLAFLLRDFYRPQRVGAIFADLFPDEYFNIQSSPLRVHQLVYRARRLLNDHDLPLTVTEDKGAYHFHLDAGLRIVIGANAASASDAVIHRIASRFGSTRFTAKEARETLGMTTSTFQRAIRGAVEKGLLARLGSGASTQYQILKKSA